MAKKLIAAVATAVMVGGVRTVIQAGEEMPELSEHDQAEGLAAGTLIDPATVTREEAARAVAERQAKKDFEQARKAVVAQQESVEAANRAAGDESEKKAEKADGKK